MALKKSQPENVRKKKLGADKHAEAEYNNNFDYIAREIWRHGCFTMDLSSKWTPPARPNMEMKKKEWLPKGGAGEFAELAAKAAHIPSKHQNM